MVIGYKKQFPDKIIAGIKIHTIRLDLKNRWRAGMKMHQSTGVRTKNYNCFREDICTGTQTIMIIRRTKHFSVYIDDVFIYNTTMRESTMSTAIMKDLARNDGFDSIQAFFEWFKEDFEGKIIHWTDLRY